MKQGRSKQQGISVWAVLTLIFGALLVFWISIKIVPEYSEASTIKRCLADAEASNRANLELSNVRTAFSRCLDVNNVRDSAQAKDVLIRGKTVVLSWTKKVEAVGNISLLLEFDAYAPKP